MNKIIVNSFVALCVLVSPALPAQDFLKNLKDFGKAVEKTQKPANEKSTTQRTENKPAQISDLSLCLDGLCVGDGLEKLSQFTWLSASEWQSFVKVRQKNVDTGLTQALGKKKVDELKKQDQSEGKLQSGKTPEERLQSELGGRIVADRDIITALARTPTIGDRQTLDSSTIELLGRVQAICFAGRDSRRKAKFVGAIKRDSPNKTMVMVEIIDDGIQPNTQRFVVSLISRTFDVDAKDQFAMNSLRDALSAQFPLTKQKSAASVEDDKDAVVLSEYGGTFLRGQASSLLFGDSAIEPKNRPELIFMKSAYFGFGDVNELWKVKGRLPDVCKQTIRTD